MAVFFRWEHRGAGFSRLSVADAGLARALFEQTTKTRFCGDLFTRAGDGPPLTDADIVGPALAAEELFHATALSPVTAKTMRRLATLEPQMLAIMHGSSTRTRCSESLLRLGDADDSMIQPG